MTFSQMKYAVEVARCGSINQAAQNLFISQSNISSSIKELETELGMKIFQRSSKGVVLTDRGKEFISYIRPLLEQKQKIEEHFSKRSTKSSLRFGISTQRYPFSVDAFLRFLKMKDIDQYEVRIKETDMYEVLEDVYNGRCDLGVIFLSFMTEKFIRKVLMLQNLEFHEIRSVTPHVFLRKTHPLAERSQITLSEIQEYPFVIFEQENGGALDFAEEVALMDFQRSDKVIYIQDRATAYNILANTDAYNIGSGLIPEGFTDARIKTIPIAGHEREMRLGWIKPKNVGMTTNMTEFVHCLEESIDDLLSIALTKNDSSICKYD